MKLVWNTLAIAALLGASFAPTSFAQEGTPAPTSQDLPGQLEKDEDQPQQPTPNARPSVDVLPKMPQALAANTTPTFPQDESVFPKPLPWENSGTTAFLVPTDTVDAFVHTYTKVACPVSLANLKFNGASQYNAVGSSIKCKYREEDATLNIFLNDKGSSAPMDQLLNNFTKLTVENFPDASIIRTGTVNVNYGNTPIECLTQEMNFSPDDQDAKAMLWACEYDGWVLQLHSLVKNTNGAAIVQKDLREFLARQTASQAHLSKCSAFVSQVANTPPANVTGISYNMEAFPYEARGDSCYAGHSTTPEGLSSLVRYWPDNVNTPLTFDFVSARGEFHDTPDFRVHDMWGHLDPSERKGGYLLMHEQLDGTITVFQGYKRVPPDRGFYGDAVNAYTGNLEPKIVARQNEDGSWTSVFQ